MSKTPRKSLRITASKKVTIIKIFGMSRTRIVKGNITKIVGGNYKRYSKDDIENIGSKVIQIGDGEGVFYGNAEDPPIMERR